MHYLKWKTIYMHLHALKCLLMHRQEMACSNYDVSPAERRCVAKIEEGPPVPAQTISVIFGWHALTLTTYHEHRVCWRRGVARFEEGLPVPAQTISMVFGSGGRRAGMIPLDDQHVYW